MIIRNTSSVEERLNARFGVPSQCPLLSGDPAAEPVLRVLRVDADAHVRRLAEIGLDRIAAKRV